jgi:hypothetical protein
MQGRARRQRTFAASMRVLVALLATAAGWLVALSHLTAALHFALVSHEICQDHGELVHAGSHAERRAPSGRRAAALPASAHADHDHCPLWTRRLEQAAVFDAPSLQVSPAAPAPGRVALADVASTPSRARRLLTAPKQSPPG